ncbi:UNVERIFIED_ORG: hypothetical protein M2420_003707 [Stenotrophomonas maltophilia]
MRGDGVSIGELISWPALSRDYVDAGIPFEQLIISAPEFRLIFEPLDGLFGMRIQIGASKRWIRSDGLKYLAIRRAVSMGDHYLEVTVSDRNLDLPMYHLISDVRSRMMQGQVEADYALQSALHGFEMVVAKTHQPSREKVIGLIGELWVLRGLLGAGLTKVNSWIGYRGEFHDFRIPGFDLEVKTTAANSRVHVMHGINQLKPTSGNLLHIISVQLGDAGQSDGFSLLDLCEYIKTELSQSPAELSEFNNAIDGLGVSKESGECKARYKLASAPMAVEIGRDLQGLPAYELSTLLGPDVGARTSDLHFKLNLDGVGVPYDPDNYGK